MRLKSGMAVLAASLTLMMSGCGMLDDILTGPDSPPRHGQDGSCETVASAQIIPFALLCDPFCDPYQLTGVELEGDVLCAAVEYGGGCSDHTFNLAVNTDVMESEPPQVQALLTHYAGNDPCDALITKKVGFDLAPLKEHMRKLTGRESGSVVLHISGASKPHSVLYHY